MLSSEITKYWLTRIVASGSFKVPTMTNGLVESSLNTRGARLLNFLIANEEPVVKVNIMSPYTFEKSISGTERKISRTEKQIPVSTNCRTNILLMHSICNGSF